MPLVIKDDDEEEDGGDGNNDATNATNNNIKDDHDSHTIESISRRTNLTTKSIKSVKSVKAVQNKVLPLDTTRTLSPSLIQSVVPSSSGKSASMLRNTLSKDSSAIVTVTENGVSLPSILSGSSGRGMEVGSNSSSTHGSLGIGESVEVKSESDSTATNELMGGSGGGWVSTEVIGGRRTGGSRVPIVEGGSSAVEGTEEVETVDTGVVVVGLARIGDLERARSIR